MNRIRAVSIFTMALVLGELCLPVPVEADSLTRCRLTRSEVDQIFVSANKAPSSSIDPILLTCAANALENRERMDDAQRLFLEAVRSAEAQARGDDLGDTLGELGQFYARNGRPGGVTEAWNRIAAIENGSGRVRGFFLLAPDVLQLAETLYRAEDLSQSFKLVTLVQAYQAETGHPLILGESWIPYLFARLGHTEEALRLFHERIRVARQLAARDGTPLFLAQELESMVDFLASIGRLNEANAARQEAELIRKSREP